MQHSIQILGFVIVFFLFWIIRKLLAPKRNFDDFFIADEGSYSLSRLQMVAWAFVVISLQVAVAVALLLNGQVSIIEYQVKFSEPILGLLGLSLGSYVTVKGIAVEQIARAKVVKREQKQWSDLITGENGLDFSRFQKLIWTTIGLFFFVAQSNIFIAKLYYFAKDNSDVRAYFMSAEELQKLNQQNKAKGMTKEVPVEEQLPTISWSLLVLMGLSQGAYVGKKLVPSYKVEEVRRGRLSELSAILGQLDVEIRNKNQELQSAALTSQQKEILGTEIAEKQRKKNDIANEMEEIKKALTEV